MIFLYILLIATGALPITVFLLKRKRYRHILHHGAKATAQVTDVRTTRYHRGSAHDRVLFAYLPFGAMQYLTGQFITKVGKHKRGELVDIYYLPQQPQKHAVPGSKGELVMLIFTLLILVFVVFACFKIHEMVKTENVTYKFQPPWER